MLTIFSVIYSSISKKFFNLFDSIYFILIPYHRICYNGELIDIIAFLIIVLVTILLLIMSGREIFSPRKDKKPIFSFFLCWWFFVCSFSSNISVLLDFKDVPSNAFYAYPMLFCLVASVIIFSIEAIKYRKIRSKSKQIISYEGLRNNFFSGFFLIVVVIMYWVPFIYFNSTTQIGINICDTILNLTYTFSLALFLMLYFGNVMAYNRYKKQNGNVDVITDLKLIKFLLWSSLAIFVLSYLVLKFVII